VDAIQPGMPDSNQLLGRIAMTFCARATPANAPQIGF